MASKVQIVNRALARLAQARLTSLDDNTQAGKLANDIYEDVAEETMSEACWTSTLRRATLAQSSTTPAFGYDYQYQLPTNPKCLRVIKINECKPGDIDYRIEGDKLLTNESTASILYVAHITDSESYDIDLRQAIIWRLVIEMAYMYTGQSKVVVALVDKAEKKIAQLISLNSLQGAREIINSDTFVDARYE